MQIVQKRCVACEAIEQLQLNVGTGYGSAEIAEAIEGLVAGGVSTDATAD